MSISNPIRTFQDFSKLNWGDVPHVEWEKWCEEVVALTPYGTKIGKGKLNFAQEGEKLYWGNKNKTCVYQFDIDTTEQEKLDFINYQLQKRAEKALERFLADDKVAVKYSNYSYGYSRQSGIDESDFKFTEFKNKKASYHTWWDYTPPDMRYDYDGCSQGVREEDVREDIDTYQNLADKVDSELQRCNIAVLEYSQYSHASPCVYGQGAENYYRFAVPLKTKKGVKIWYIRVEEGLFPFLPKIGKGIEKPDDFDDKLNQLWESGNKEIALNLYCGQKGINPLFAILAVKLKNASNYKNKP